MGDGKPGEKGGGKGGNQGGGKKGDPGWPSKTENPSGPGRKNAPPKK